KDPTSKDGLVIVATEPTNCSQYRMLSEPGILTDNEEPNNCLSIAHIQDKYFRHNRSFRSGYMNNEQKTFESSVKAKIGKPFKIPLCFCNEESIDINQPIKTRIGVGDVINASFDYYLEWVELTVGYPTDDYETEDEQ